MSAERRTIALWALLMVFSLAACSPAAAGGLGEPGEIVTVTGEVLEVDTSDMAVDGPARIRLRTGSLRSATILVQSCLGGCALEAVEALGDMQRGESWQAIGELQQDGDIVIYDATAHALRPADDG